MMSNIQNDICRNPKITTPLLPLQQAENIARPCIEPTQARFSAAFCVLPTGWLPRTLKSGARAGTTHILTFFDRRRVFLGFLDKGLPASSSTTVDPALGQHSKRFLSTRLPYKCLVRILIRAMARLEIGLKHFLFDLNSV